MAKDIIVNATAEESRVAILDKGKLEEFYVERTVAQRLVGNIYKGKVESVLPGIGAAFVNIGLEKNGFLYVDDVIEEGSPYSEIIQEEMGRGYKKRERPESPKRISEVLKKGQEILVQIVKEPIGTKGARLTAHIALPGKYLVFMAHDRHRGVSRKIMEQKERKRLKDIIGKWNLPKEMGIIIRTAAANHAAGELKRESLHLYKLYRRLEKIASRRPAPSLIHEEYGLIQRIARDNFKEDTKLMAIDSRDECKKTLALLRMISPKMRSRVKFYKGQMPIFEKFNIAGDIEKIYKRKVQLPSRGYIIIEPAEALVTIDVNTGGFSGKSPQDTAFIVNKEAAVEIARQLRLRDMGGIIVIDFIDMGLREHRNVVFQTLLKTLKTDKAKIKVLNFSKIGLVEMTRQRMRRSLESVSYQGCPYCRGKGIVKSPLTMSIEVIRLLEKRLKSQRCKRVEVLVNPKVKEYIVEKYKKTLIALGKRARCRIALIDNPSLHIEDIRINTQ